MSALKTTQAFPELERGASQAYRLAPAPQPAVRSLAAFLAETVAVDLPNGGVMVVDLGDLREILRLR